MGEGRVGWLGFGAEKGEGFGLVLRRVKGWGYGFGVRLWGTAFGEGMKGNGLGGRVGWVWWLGRGMGSVWWGCYGGVAMEVEVVGKKKKRLERERGRFWGERRKKGF
ncbi:uncharacterized protein G2W53_041457 [Senna tora]|uniref:Uncharacterized protein n=1 Tax=Senna tora TaxID=362788 RepID=A0A834SFP8_9FABA|nr:uncharacterized protein G2W53_041457 [Senna tora]